MSEYNEQTDIDFVANLAALTTEAMQEVEEDIRRGGKGLDAEDHPEFTATEIILAKIADAIYSYSARKGLRIPTAIREINT